MELITYRSRQVQLVPKKIKHCYFRAKPGEVIMVTYNKNMKKQVVLELLDKNWDLLEERLARIRTAEKYEQTLEHGSTVYYLGQQYNLEIVANSKPKVELNENIAYLHTPHNDFIVKDKIFKKWYVTQANMVLSEYYQQYLPKVTHWNITYPKLKFRKMVRLWGSYNKRTNTVTLNTHLIKTSPKLINYVIAHELCHTIYFDHSKNFYNLLATIHPNWKEDKTELNKYTNKCVG